MAQGMNGLAIESDRVVAAGSAVQETGALLGREIATMRELLDDIRVGWRSDQAAPRYAAALTGYLDEAATLKEALITHGSALAVTGRHFAQTEAIVAATVPGAR